MNTKKSASARNIWIVLTTPWADSEIAFEVDRWSVENQVGGILTRNEHGFSRMWEDDTEDVVLLKQHRNATAFRKFTIHQLCLIVNNAGSHPLFEKTQKKTTPRKMFQVIRDLRMKGVPIVGDVEGLWIARSENELREFCDRIEQKAKSDIASMMTLRKTMMENLNDKKQSLFDRWFGDAFKLD